MNRHVLLVGGSRLDYNWPGAGSSNGTESRCLFPLLSVVRQLIDGIGLNVVQASRFNLVLSYVAYYQIDEVDWSVVDLCDQFMLHDFEAGSVHLLRYEIIPGHRQALGIAHPTGSSD